MVCGSSKSLRIAVVCQWRVPPETYGGADRAAGWLATDLARRGHRVTLIAAPGSRSDLAEVRVLDPKSPAGTQIPEGTDVAHFFFPPEGEVPVPYLVWIQGNPSAGSPIDRNTVFVSAKHAERYGSNAFVYNGIDPADYGPVDWARPRTHLHFLAKASWKVKNLKGAMRVARLAGRRLVVMGGTRLSFSMGFRLTLDPRIRFAGMVGGVRKNAILNASRGLVFPVRWHEPFGIAVIESLYFGCPVLATPYGSLPELVPPDVGMLSTRAADLAEAARAPGRFDPRRCHEWVMDRFTAPRVTDAFLALYERVLNGEPLNQVTPRLSVEALGRLLPWED
ncbi:MAG TPA: glycosyltransferase [Gemmatimonadales bacterium]